MSMDNLRELLDKIAGFVRQEAGVIVFRMPAEALQSQAVATLVRERLASPTGDFLLRDPTKPEIREETVYLAGYMEPLLGRASAWLEVRFDLADAGRPSMLVAFAPRDPRQPRDPEAWNLGVSFPVWAKWKSVLARLQFDRPAFYFTSIPRPAQGERPALTDPLHFTAAALLPCAAIGILQVLPPDRGFRAWNGAVRGESGKPLMDLQSAPLEPFSFKPIELSLTMTMHAISSDTVEMNKIYDPPPPVHSFLEVHSQIHLGGAEIPSIPLWVRFGAGSRRLVFHARLDKISTYALSSFAQLVKQAPIADCLKSVVDIGTMVQLQELDIYIDTDPLGVSAVGLTLGTAAALTIVPHYMEIPTLQVRFMVSQLTDKPTITAVLKGKFTFLDEIHIETMAVFPDLRFIGRLDPDSSLDLARLCRRFVPGITLPPVTLDELEVYGFWRDKSYGMRLGLSSDWKIPIGIASFQLAEAHMELQYSAGRGSGFSGAFSAVAHLFSSGGVDIADFYISWDVPGDLLLQGTFPEIPLSELAKTLTGGFLPVDTGLPVITLKNSRVALRIGKGQENAVTAATTYDFTLSTTIEVEKIGKAALFFEIRKDTSVGFVAGLVVQPSWTPAQLWEGLQTVFQYVELQQAGVILSSLKQTDFSLPDMALPWVPKEIKPGVTFFASLLFKGEVFGLLQNLFAVPTALHFYAYIDVANLTRSEIVASLPASSGKGVLSFEGLDIVFKPGQLRFSITAGATFRLFQETLTLRGTGSIQAEPPAVAVNVVLANWKNPCGIQGLEIETFGLSIIGGSVGMTLGLMGSFVIGSGERRFRFKVGGTLIDFQAPGALVFALEAVGKSLLLADLISQFTPLPPGDVPLIKDLGFKKLDFFVVIDPSGWEAPDGHCYAPGIGIDSGVMVYGWEAILQMEVSTKKGVVANGSLSKPIVVGDVLTLSDESGTKGPSLAIDTSPLIPGGNDDVVPAPSLRRPPSVVGIDRWSLFTTGDNATTYFSASGGVHLLGLQERFSGEITSEGFAVNFHADLAHLYRARFMCSFSMEKGFVGSAEGRFDLSLDLPDGYSVAGVRIIPPVCIKGPQARLAVDCALSLSAAWLNLELEFHWGSVHIQHKIRLDAAKIPGLLADLWNTLKKWLLEHIADWLSPLLNDVKQYLQALADGLLRLGQNALEIGKALYHCFQVTDMRKLAEMLVNIGWLAFDDMVKAVMSLFSVGFNEAAKLISELMEICPITTANAVLKSPDA